jgi:hypothetical protein
MPLGSWKLMNDYMRNGLQLIHKTFHLDENLDEFLNKENGNFSFVSKFNSVSDE